jgi:cullin-associated NEDD8-dissociated protein 1
MLAVNQASRDTMSDSVVVKLVDSLVPILEPKDLHMMSPALIVLAAFAKDKPKAVSKAPVVKGICAIVRAPLSGVALDALLTCVEAIGHAGVGKSLMSALLQMAPQGDTDVTGQVIGTLLVSNCPSPGVFHSFLPLQKLLPLLDRDC